MQDTPKRKKRKKAGDDCPSAAEDSGLVALGTTAGSVLLYSVVKGELHSRLVSWKSLISFVGGGSFIRYCFLGGGA